MTVTRQSLVDHFGRLSDDELLNEFQSGELTALAHDVATAELRRRGIDLFTRHRRRQRSRRRTSG
jgi:hypothetical protein